MRRLILCIGLAAYGMTTPAAAGPDILQVDLDGDGTVDSVSRTYSDGVHDIQAVLSASGPVALAEVASERDVLLERVGKDEARRACSAGNCSPDGEGVAVTIAEVSRRIIVLEDASPRSVWIAD